MSAPILPDGGLPTAIARVDVELSSPRYPTGDRAALRRMIPGRPCPLPFYRFAIRILPDDWDRDAATRQSWMAIVAGIALMGPDAHRPDRRLGRVLAEVGYSETRLERLLSAGGHTARTLVLRTARFLAAKSAPCNWVDLAQILLIRQAERRDDLALRIARDFYAQ